MSGLILYDGPSAINGERVVAIITNCTALGHRASTNSKTGPMAQVWIIEPGKTLAQMRDPSRCTATCGDCPIKNGCYVTPMAVSSVSKAFSANRYQAVTDAHAVIIRHARVRWGAFGDPNAIPSDVLQRFVGPSHTGYTHSSHCGSIPWLTSVESLDAARDAWARGKRTFRVLHAATDRVDRANEVMCPAWNGRSSCDRCALCSPFSQAKSVCIEAHGVRKAAIA